MDYGCHECVGNSEFPQVCLRCGHQYEDTNFTETSAQAATSPGASSPATRPDDFLERVKVFLKYNFEVDLDLD